MQTYSVSGSRIFALSVIFETEHSPMILLAPPYYPLLWSLLTTNWFQHTPTVLHILLHTSLHLAQHTNVENIKKYQNNFFFLNCCHICKQNEGEGYFDENTVS